LEPLELSLIPNDEPKSALHASRSLDEKLRQRLAIDL
jgi:hypothetical protein